MRPKRKRQTLYATISRDERFVRRVFQEIIIHRDGSVEIEWINPTATPLILEIWDEVSEKNSFPIRVNGDSPIYCG